MAIYNLKCIDCQSIYPKYSIEHEIKKWNHKKLCPDCRKTKSINIRYNVTEELFRASIAESVSISQALEKMGVKAAGGNYEVFNARVKKLQIDISHFTGMAWNKGQKHSSKRKLEDYLSNNAAIGSFKLKNRILKEGLKPHECENCLNTKWLDNPIPLELHHINGNSKDNSLVNLQLLCPNCHSLTDNYRGKNKSKIG